MNSQKKCTIISILSDFYLRIWWVERSHIHTSQFICLNNLLEYIPQCMLNRLLGYHFYPLVCLFPMLRDSQKKHFPIMKCQRIIGLYSVGDQSHLFRNSEQPRGVEHMSMKLCSTGLNCVVFWVMVRAHEWWNLQGQSSRLPLKSNLKVTAKSIFVPCPMW